MEWEDGNKSTKPEGREGGNLLERVSFMRLCALGRSRDSFVGGGDGW